MVKGGSTITVEQKSLSDDDASLAVLNGACDDIATIFEKRGIDLSFAMNVLSAAMVKAIWLMERNGADAEEVIAFILTIIRGNLTAYRRQELDG